jgi:hypothetical protein
MLDGSKNLRENNILLAYSTGPRTDHPRLFADDIKTQNLVTLGR